MLECLQYYHVPYVFPMTAFHHLDRRNGSKGGKFPRNTPGKGLFYFIFIYFIFHSHFFATGPRQTTSPPPSVIATAAGRFWFRFVCPAVVGIRGHTRSYDPYGEEEGNLTQRGFIYNHFPRRSNTGVWRCYTSGRVRQRMRKKWNGKIPHTPRTTHATGRRNHVQG